MRNKDPVVRRTSWKFDGYTRRNRKQIILTTYSFQAPALYTKRGFRVLATLDDCPHGHQNLRRGRACRHIVVPLE